MNLLRMPLTWVWLLLASLTVISFALGVGNRAGAESAALWSAIALILISFAKVRLIMSHFMEVRHAPWPLRLICDAWIVVVAGALILTYLGIGQPDAAIADTAASPAIQEENR